MEDEEVTAKKTWQMNPHEYAAATNRTVMQAWAQYWRRSGRMGLIGTALFIPAEVPKWGVVVNRIHDEIMVADDFYNYNEAVRVARRIRLLHVKGHMTRKFRSVKRK